VTAYLVRPPADRADVKGDPLVDRLTAYACVLERIEGELRSAYYHNRGKKKANRFDGFFFSGADGSVLATSLGGRVYQGGQVVQQSAGEYIQVQRDAVVYLYRCAAWARFHIANKLHRAGFDTSPPRVPDTEGCPKRVAVAYEACKRAAEEELAAAGFV